MEQQNVDTDGASVQQGLRRRAFLRLAGLAGSAALASACAPASPPAAAPTAKPAATSGQPAATTAPAASAVASSPVAASAATTAPAQGAAASADWDKLVAAGKQEGQVVVTTLAGDGYRKLMEAFQAALPGISVEHKTVASASFLAPQVLQEQSGGVFSYDVALLSPGGPVMGSMMPGGAFDDIRPVLTQPEVKADAGWVGGFEGGFMDKARQKVYSISWDKNITLFRNTDLVPDTDVKGVRDMLDPKWKGKLMFLDYTTGFTYTLAVGINYHLKDQAAEVIKGIFKDQAPTFERDGRAVAEALIRGQVAMGTGPTPAIMDQFYSQGVGKNVQPFDLPELRTITMYGVMLYQKAPHPNAARVLINWLLGKAGGDAFGKNVGLNSRRLDVPPIAPDNFPGADYEAAKKSYLLSNIEESLPLQQQAIDQLKALVVA
jgi:iron(III) transport system substrate-binding protein